MMRFALAFLLILLAAPASAQTLPPIPERIVSLECSNCRISDALAQIAAQGKFEFSYNAQLFDPAKTVTIRKKNITVRRALFLLFGNSITFKVRGNHLVLVAAPAPLPASTAPPPKRTYYAVSGYTLDAATGTPIAHVSVYDPVTLASALSDEYGHYSLQLAAGRQPVQLRASREQYTDTTFSVTPVANVSQDVHLRALPPPVVVIPDTTPAVKHDTSYSYGPLPRGIQRYPFLDSLVGYIPVMQSRNLKEYFERGVQISVIPFVSTNGMLGGNVINRVSLNIIGGYTGGTDGVELGGVFNIDRHDVRWLQLAGVFNAVGGNVTGVQAAGSFNLVQGSVTGVQLAGGVNCLFDTLRGAQLSGGVNIIHGTVYGGQFAAGANFVSRDMDGAQVAGGANITLGNVHTFQGAGGLNYALNVKGVQAAAGANVTPGSLTGTQIAAGFNFARHMRGFQAGTINIAGDVRGKQLGVLNFADTCAGLPVGVLSFVRKGVHELEFASTEKGMLSASFRTGVPAFYNILCVSMHAQSDRLLWGFGYGLGHRFRLSKQFGLNLDLVAQHLSTETFADYTNEYAQVSLMLEWRPKRAFAITAGPTFNYYITGGDPGDLRPLHETPTFTGAPATGYTDMGWPGAKFAIRVF